MDRGYPLLKTDGTQREPRGYSGWALQQASWLDAVSPGLLNTSLYFSDLKRQALCVCLSEIDWANPEMMATRLRAVAPAACAAGLDPKVQIARALVTARAREIVRATYGALPNGLLGALARVGAQPLPKDDYRVLMRFFSDPKLRRKGRVLQHVGTIDARVLRVMEIVDNPDLHNPAIIRLLAHQTNAYDFVETIRWLQDLDHVDEQALGAAVRKATSKRSLGHTLRQCVERTEHSPGLPVLNHPEFQVLTRVSQLRQKGLEYRVCLGSSDIILEVVLGFVAYAEWRPSSDKLGAIVELRPLVREVDGERHWYVASVNLADNAAVPLALRDRVCNELAKLGIFRPVRPTGTETAACVSRLLRRLGGDWLVDLEMA